MKFSLTVPFTRAEGASVPIQILTRSKKVLYTGTGQLVTGSPICGVKKSLNLDAVLHENVFLIGLNDGKIGIEIPVLMAEAEEDDWPKRKGYPDVILGMAFLRHFLVNFNGPAQTASLILNR